MDPIRSLTNLAASGMTKATEGKVESRDERKGTVVVRLPGNETVVAQGSGLQPGDRVALARTPEGAWIARPLPKQEGQSAPVLSSWMTEPPGSELGEALRSGEPRMIRTALVALWRRMDAVATQELPQALQEARRRGLPPLVSRADPGARTVPTPGSVPLALRAETSPGVYRGEIPGRRFELTGPPGVPLGEAGLWTESVLSEILSVWLPAAVEDVAVPGLPARVAADASGARRLLDHLGVELSAEEAESPSFRALVRTLVRAAALFAGDAPAGDDVPASGPDSPTRIPGPASGSVPTLAVRGSATPHPSVPTSLARGETPMPNPAGGLELPELPDFAVSDQTQVPASEARSETLRLLDPARSQGGEPSVSLPTSGKPGLGPQPETLPPSEAGLPASRATGVFVGMLPPPNLGIPDTPPSLALDGSQPAPAGLPAGGDPSAPGVPVTRELPAMVALRVVLAWLASAEEPTEALLRAAVGGFRELPESLQILARAQERRPEDFDAVATFLRQASNETPLLPRDLGLDRRPSGEGVPEVQPARPLSQAIVEDLAKALSQGRTEDASVLREALGSLVGEALDRARDPSNPMASAPWTMPPSEERPDSGRVVVRDRRTSPKEASDKTVVEISMNPSGLGSVDARLTLRGDDLDVVFHAREVATVDRIREHLPELRGVLTQLGLQPRDLDARAGKPGAVKRSTEVRESSGGLDIRA